MNPVTPSASGEPAPLVAELRGLIQSARHAAAQTVNTLQVLTNFEIGRRIVEHEQQGERRAEYGKALLKAISVRLTEEFGKGFSEDNLARMRNFYSAWNDRGIEFPRSLRGNFQADTGTDVTPARPANFSTPFPLSWSHYVLLLTIKNSQERNFYEIEAAQSGWSLPTRNIGLKPSGQLSMRKAPKKTVRPEPVEGRLTKPFMVRSFDQLRTHHERPRGFSLVPGCSLETGA